MIRRLEAFFSSRRISDREIRQKQTRQRRLPVGCEMPAVQVETLERRQLLSVTQTIRVLDSYGSLLANALVSGTNGNQTLAPIRTNGRGEAVLSSSSALRSLLVSHKGFATVFTTINQSAGTYVIQMQSLANGLITQRFKMAVNDAQLLCATNYVFKGSFQVSKASAAVVYAGTPILAGCTLLGLAPTVPTKLVSLGCIALVGGTMTVAARYDSFVAAGKELGLWTPATTINMYDYTDMDGQVYRFYQAR